MIQELIIDLADDIKKKLIEKQQLQQVVREIEQHIEIVKDREERLQIRLTEGETNPYSGRRRELEQDKLYTELAIGNLSEQIQHYKQRLYKLVVEKEGQDLES